MDLLIGCARFGQAGGKINDFGSAARTRAIRVTGDEPEQPGRPARHPFTGDSRALRHAVIALLVVLLGVILFGGGALAVDLGKRAWVQWERFIATREMAFPPVELSPADRRTDDAPSTDAPAPPATYAEVVPAKYQGLPIAQPIFSPATWIRADDYPPESLRREEEGSVAIFYVVGPNGRVEHCMVQQSSGSPRLDAQTCALVASRGLFAPAVNGAGKATRSSGRLRFRWQIAE